MHNFIYSLHLVVAHCLHTMLCLCMYMCVCLLQRKRYRVIESLIESEAAYLTSLNIAVKVSC